MTNSILAQGASRFVETRDANTSALDESGLYSRASNMPGRAYSDAIDDLLSIRELQNDWDGEGSDAPSIELTYWVGSYLIKLRDAGFPVPDRIVATVNATIQLEWENNLGGYLEIEAVEPNQVEGRLLRRGSSEAISVLLQV
jgi:hypothetical protein